MIQDKSHRVRYEVCYSDTDAGGVVAHLNYLRFAEAARSQLVRDLGESLWKLQTEQKIGFVTREFNVVIKEPLRLDDAYVVCSQAQNISRTGVEFVQTIVREHSERVVAIVVCKMACVGETFRPVRIPENYTTILEKISAD